MDDTDTEKTVADTDHDSSEPGWLETATKEAKRRGDRAGHGNPPVDGPGIRAVGPQEIVS